MWLASAEVPLALYGAELIRSRLQNLEWVSEIALAHAAVVEHFARARGATVVPMKLFTLFSSVERALAEMHARRLPLGRVIKRIRGADEWGVRIARNTAFAGGEAVPVGPASSGAAFLAAKKRARDQARAQSVGAAQAAERSLEALARLAKGTRRQPPPEGAAAPPLVDAALLVPASRKETFKLAARREAERCRTAGADLTLTGPWPAYNFVQLEEARS